MAIDKSQFSRGLQGEENRSVARGSRSRVAHCYTSNRSLAHRLDLRASLQSVQCCGAAFAGQSAVEQRKLKSSVAAMTTQHNSTRMYRTSCDSNLNLLRSCICVILLLRTNVESNVACIARPEF